MMLDWNARALALNHLRERADMWGSRATTTTHQVDPAVIDKALERRRHTLGRLQVDAVFVGQSRVGYARHASLSQFGEASNAIGHELGPGRAVQPDRQQIGVHQRSRERLDSLTGEH